MRIAPKFNAVLANAQEYTLSFGTVEAETDVVRRNISLNFRSVGYEGDIEIFSCLYENTCRHMFDDIGIGSENNGGLQ